MSFGEVAEWSIAAVLKTVELRGSGGSNPSLSARSQCRTDDESHPFCFCVYVSVSKLPPQTQNTPACRRVLHYVYSVALLAISGVGEPIDRGLIARQRLRYKVSVLLLCSSNPCGEQKGKALSGATIGSVVANPSLSARIQNRRQAEHTRPHELYLPTPFHSLGIAAFFLISLKFRWDI